MILLHNLKHIVNKRIKINCTVIQLSRNRFQNHMSIQFYLDFLFYFALFLFISNLYLSCRTIIYNFILFRILEQGCTFKLCFESVYLSMNMIINHHTYPSEYSDPIKVFSVNFVLKYVIKNTLYFFANSWQKIDISLLNKIKKRGEMIGN